ncbi:hypothetical protein BD626DRAFT_507490 [Schizophyllum amplum]|uniref:Uncharacterized protein n=1 Tax=Schizophyllum amplum TaxID=97359 RepID=A0A550C405_9AGAR|nr:hypothetical protein BD626DRAFT_507490 [Auriculariopsis ampla]
MSMKTPRVGPVRGRAEMVYACAYWGGEDSPCKVCPVGLYMCAYMRVQCCIYDVPVAEQRPRRSSFSMLAVARMKPCREKACGINDETETDDDGWRTRWWKETRA